MILICFDALIHLTYFTVIWLSCPDCSLIDDESPGKQVHENCRHFLFFCLVSAIIEYAPRQGAQT